MEVLLEMQLGSSRGEAVGPKWTVPNAQLPAGVQELRLLPRESKDITKMDPICQ